MTSVALFTQDLRSLPAEDVVWRHVFTDTPHVFRGKAGSLNLLRQHLSKRLNVAENDIVVVGSAQTGFSLAPDSFPRAFHAGSDIDIAVIDQRLFDMMWHTILKWHYPRREARLPYSDWRWRIHRSDDVYWGWFVPDQIRYEGLSFPTMLKSLRDASTIWFNAFRSLARFPEFASRDVSGRLYRTWEHATMYHAEGLQLILKQLAATKGTPA